MKISWGPIQQNNDKFVEAHRKPLLDGQRLKLEKPSNMDVGRVLDAWLKFVNDDSLPLDERFCFKSVKGQKSKKTPAAITSGQTTSSKEKAKAKPSKEKDILDDDNASFHSNGNETTASQTPPLDDDSDDDLDGRDLTAPSVPLRRSSRSHGGSTAVGSSRGTEDAEGRDSRGSTAAEADSRRGAPPEDHDPAEPTVSVTVNLPQSTEVGQRS